MNRAQKYLRKIPQYSRMGRHLRAVVEHGNARKWANLLRVEYERKRLKIAVKGRPYILFLDPCNFCNLRCPLCPTGMNELGRVQSMMSLDCFKKYLEPHIPYAFEVNVHNWGESMINPAVYEMIEYAQRNNVGTNMSSNLSIAKRSDLENIVDSGLEYLTISLDGADEASYSKYRVRGDYEKVMNNVAELIRIRDAKGSKTPFVEWQYIVMKHNEDKVEMAEKLAKDLGVDLLRFIPCGIPYETKNREELAEEWYPVKLEGRNAGDMEGVPLTHGQTDKPSPCFYLYRSMVVNSNGGVSPCCIVYRSEWDFDDLSKHETIDVGEIWNNPKYQSARSLYSPKRPDQYVPTVCDGCDIFARHPSKVTKD